MNDRPTMDPDGYPTEETLQKVREWPCTGDDVGDGLFDYLADAWRYDDYYNLDAGDGQATFSTGGWSGHESLINAACQNFIWWSLHWVSTTRGGHYVFERCAKETGDAPAN